MWDLSSLPRDQTQVPLIARQILYHWTMEIPALLLLLLNFFILYWVSLMNSVVIITGKQRRNSVIHIHAYISPPNPLPIQVAT